MFRRTLPSVAMLGFLFAVSLAFADSGATSQQLQVPEDARAALIEGDTYVKLATDPSQYELAIQSFQRAIAIAPWWGTPYFDLATAQELTGKLADARASLQAFLARQPTPDLVRKANARIQDIDAKLGNAEQEQHALATFIQSLEGAEFRGPAHRWSGGESWDEVRVQNGRMIYGWPVDLHFFPNCTPVSGYGSDGKYYQFDCSGAPENKSGVPKYDYDPHYPGEIWWGGGLMPVSAVITGYSMHPKFDQGFSLQGSPQNEYFSSAYMHDRDPAVPPLHCNNGTTWDPAFTFSPDGQTITLIDGCNANATPQILTRVSPAGRH